jgi:hypothetical protein
MAVWPIKCFAFWFMFANFAYPWKFGSGSSIILTRQSGDLKVTGNGYKSPPVTPQTAGYLNKKLKKKLIKN